MTIADPWRPRPCETCAKLFTPRSQNRKDAERATCCSPRCRALKSHRTMAARPGGRTLGHFMKPLEGADLVPCTQCHLRGHEAGDVDKCLVSSKLYQRGAGGAGLGGQWW